MRRPLVPLLLTALLLVPCGLAAGEPPRSYFVSQLGFQVAIPPRWTVYESEQTVTIQRLIAGQADGFFVRLCPTPRPESCLMNAGMPARLLAQAPVRMAGQPTIEYTFHRETAAKTRLWEEVITLATIRGRTYAVIAQIPGREREPEYRRLYREIRQSFRLRPGS